ncbi:MAG: DUF1573 domain-containing protein [Tidjanibacter sp.]|nr:DUF1573 domain-containing protein [Tidjanibacter sp.]
MKRVLLITSMLLLLLTEGLMAQSDKSSGLTAIGFKELSHDFGTMEQGSEKVSYEFEFTNEGAGPLIITRTENSCRCISVAAPKRPIKPNGTGVITITFDPKDKGVFNKAIEIYANIPGRRITLLVTGEVK